MHDDKYIMLAHGGGGQLGQELVREVILPALGAAQSQDERMLTDAAQLELGGGRVAFTTDSYVVRPLEFPGGDIGKLAVCGTVNDLAVVGARPMYMSLALVLREGLEIDLLRRVMASAGKAAAAAGVKIVTGDTKVVERSACDGMIVNTAGVGVIRDKARLGFDKVIQGDRVLLSGSLGEHGMAVMSKRENLHIAAELASDCAAINDLAAALVEELGDAVRWMRDPTRGGLAATLAELAAATGHDIEVRESAIPTNRTAVAVAEMLGLDLLSAANEGKLVAVVSADAAEAAREILRRFEIAGNAAIIGEIGAKAGGGEAIVELVTGVGGRRIVQMPYGEELPRIC